MRAFNFVLFAVGVLVHVNAQPTETESKQAQLSLMVSPFKTSSGKYLRVLQVKDNDANEERVFSSEFLKKFEKLIPGTRANKAAALARAEAISREKSCPSLSQGQITREISCVCARKQ
ncbi:hypothetical protein ON010_g18841 [Phytophthora cinnamomi]|nr:hypothetical protein ON010_g18841 [Phytophthora cinnamomi]